MLPQVARMAFGGMAPTTAMPAKTMRFLVGRKWNRETFDLGCDSLLEDLPLPPGVPGAMVRYRRALTISFLFKAFLTVSKSSGVLPLAGDQESATEVKTRSVKQYRVPHVLVDWDWVDLIFGVPLSAQCCFFLWKFGRC